jgi:hypothetical protein
MRHFRPIDGDVWTIVGSKNVSPMHITCSSLVPNPPLRHVWTRAQVNADSNLQFKVTIASGENGQLVGINCTHTLPVSLGTGLNTRHSAHATHRHTHDRHTTDKFLLLFFNRQYWWAAQTKRLNERDTAQNKGKMEEAPACVDKQRKTTNPCPNRNYY